MTRKEKLKILQGIINGNLSIENLQPHQVFIFMERSTNPGVYEHNGKEYNEIEYQVFCEKLKRRNSNSIIWNEGKEYPEEDAIITFRRYESLNM